MFVALLCEEYPEGGDMVPEITHVLVPNISTNAANCSLCILTSRSTKWYFYTKNSRRLEIIQQINTLTHETL